MKCVICQFRCARTNKKTKKQPKTCSQSCAGKLAWQTMLKH